MNRKKSRMKFRWKLNSLKWDVMRFFHIRSSVEREVDAIRLQIHNETKGMTIEQRMEFYRKRDEEREKKQNETSERAFTSNR